MSDTPAAAAKSEGEKLARPIEECVQMVFPTPIAIYDWPDSEMLNAALRTIVLAAESGAETLPRSNVGGWHSDPDFIHRTEPCFEQLRQRIRTLMGEMTRLTMKPGNHRYRLEGWANVLRKGQYNSIHVHPNSTWSGVYYVTGNPPPIAGEGVEQFSGKLELIDPRPAASATYTIENMMQQRSFFNPPAGAMILFPSWMQHQVHPYFGPDVRISIAFNVLLG